MKHTKYKNKQWLEEQYITLRKSYATIAKEVECNSDTIYYWAQKFGIISRSNSESKKGIPLSEETKQKLRGRKQTKESNEKRSKALKGIPKSDETKRRMSIACKGRILSEEHKRHLSERIVSEETKKKMSENHADVSGEKNPIFGKPRSDETKRKISEANSNPSDETRRKMSLSRKKFVGKNHPNFGKRWKLSAKVREQMSISRKGTRIGPDNPMYGRIGKLNPFFGKHHTEETKKILSDKNSNPSEETRRKMSAWLRPSGKDHPLYGKSPSRYSGFGKGGSFKKSDGTIIWLRSSYELSFATTLEQKGIVWEYEKCINLQDDIWHPDFYLPEYKLFIETKGWLTDDAKRKMIKFNNEYPDVKLLVWGKKDIDLFSSTNISVDEVGILLNDYLKLCLLAEEK